MKAKKPAKPRGPTFFGVGAPKAGTSWLYKVLSSYPDCGLPPHKELHFWDVRHGETVHSFSYVERLKRAAEMAAEIAELAEAEATPDSPSMFADGFMENGKVPRLIEKLSLYIEPLRFHDVDSYIRYLNRHRRPANGLAGEITPMYAELRQEGFAEMVKWFPDSRFVFIMRDPVERAWSHARFLTTRDKAISAAEQNRMIELEPIKAPILKGSDYRGTITRLEAVVPRERIHYMFFEPLTDPARVVGQMRGLESFLDLNPQPARSLERFAETPENVSPGWDLSPAGRRRLMGLLGPTYAFVRERFGSLPKDWADPAKALAEQAS